MTKATKNIEFMDDGLDIPYFAHNAYYRRLECDRKLEELFAKWEKHKEEKRETKKLMIAFIIFIIPIMYLAGYMQQVTGSVL